MEVLPTRFGQRRRFLCLRVQAQDLRKFLQCIDPTLKEKASMRRLESGLSFQLGFVGQ